MLWVVVFTFEKNKLIMFELEKRVIEIHYILGVDLKELTNSSTVGRNCNVLSFSVDIHHIV